MKFQNYSDIRTRFILAISERKKGFGFLFFNICGNVLTLILNLTLPFYLSVRGYGEFALIYALYNVCIAFFTFGLDSSVFKFVLDKTDNSRILIISFLVWLFLSISLLLIISPIAWFTISTGILKISFEKTIVTILASFILSFQRIVLSYYIAKSEIKKYGSSFIFNKAVQLGTFILILSIFTENVSLKLIPYLLLTQSVLTLIHILILQRKELRFFIPNSKEILELTRFTLPLSLDTLGNLGYNYGFTLLISPFLSLSQLGILNIYTQLGSIVSLTTNALNSGYLPTFFKQVKTNFRNSVRKYFYYIITNSLIITFAVFSLGILYKMVSKSINDNYSILLLFIYLFGILIYSFKSIGSSYLLIKGKTMYMSTITIISSALTLSMGFIITNKWGFIGCIISLCLGYIIQVILFNVKAIKAYSIGKL